MRIPRPARLTARTASFTAAGLLLTAALTGCGGDDTQESDNRACGLIDRDLVTKVAGTDGWRDVGTLYDGTRLGDGCTITVSGRQVVVISLVDFEERSAATTSRRELVAQRDALERTCAGSDQAAPTDDEVTAVCATQEKVTYAAWNPQRLVRVTADRGPGREVTTEDVEAISADINRRADDL